MSGSLTLLSNYESATASLSIIAIIQVSIMIKCVRSLASTTTCDPRKAQHYSKYLTTTVRHVTLSIVKTTTEVRDEMGQGIINDNSQMEKSRENNYYRSMKASVHVKGLRRTKKAKFKWRKS